MLGRNYVPYNVIQVKFIYLFAFMFVKSNFCRIFFQQENIYFDVFVRICQYFFIGDFLFHNSLFSIMNS